MEEMNNAGGSVAAGKYNGLLIAAGWIAAIVSLFIYPFIFGVLGVALGVLATKGGSRSGLPVIVASIVLMGLGLIFGPVLLNYLRLFLNV